MPSEDAFVQNALEFLQEIGADTSLVTADTHLFEAGLLDSLGTLAFLDFLEQQRGAEVEIDSLDFDTIATLRSTYAFVFPR
ncbi:phosphopantetheine-binding protein [Streptomyces sp. NPDC002809]|uniref:phosphopantetheine-binding protein n=1 Tax=Streptomyces sp. NPDC002809 TaxID=3154433 RepID=UPI00333419E2